MLKFLFLLALATSPFSTAFAGTESDVNLRMNESANAVDGSFYSCAAFAKAVVTGQMAEPDVLGPFAFFPQFQLTWAPGDGSRLWVDAIRVVLPTGMSTIYGPQLVALLGSVNRSLPDGTRLNSQDPTSRPYMTDRRFPSDGTILPPTGRVYQACGLTVPLPGMSPGNIHAELQIVGQIEQTNGTFNTFKIRKSIVIYNL